MNALRGDDADRAFLGGRRLTIGFAAVVALAALGLGFATLNSRGGTGTHDRTTPRLVVLKSPSAGGVLHDAEVIGVLRSSPNGCVVLESGDGVQRVTVWQAGLRLGTDDGGFVILDADGTALAREGDRISVGGGYVPVTPQSAAVLAECANVGDIEALVGSAIRVVG